MRIFTKILIVFSSILSINGQELHTEIFRPQYHLSPEWGWMGDPNGMIYYEGKYHLLWWGHAISEDLIHWKEYSHFAMNGDPGGFGYWSGCVVVDTANTAGFGTDEDTAMIALYTMHFDNGVEKVGLSSSLNHVTFQYYVGNPVINLDQYDFRDPTVFWNNESNRWIMAITRSVERQVEFYSSENLLQWNYLSSFNVKGAKDQVWEVPDLFQLPVNGNTDSLKWILTCGMGPNKMQYWIGDFNGTEFILDPEDHHNTGNNVPGEVFEDFEGANYGNWTVEGTAFGSRPVRGTLPDQQEVNGFIGSGFINTYLNGDGTIGKLISPEFTIEHRYVNFLIGGGAGTDRQIRIVIDDQVVASATSVQNQEHLRWQGIDLNDWIGLSAHIEIADEATGGWGHLLLDHIVFSDVLYDTKIEHANWADWGTDFYAARSFRNFSENNVNQHTWIGWMGNWSYANEVPTKPWKGNQSLPRSISLAYDDSGYKLIQKPIETLMEIRNSAYTDSNISVSGAHSIPGLQPAWNVYEMKISFKVQSDNQLFTLELASDGASNKLVVGFDASTSQVFIDRTAFRNGFSHFNYLREMAAPIEIPEDSIIDFHIFMDQSSIELFVNDYSIVLSALAFSKPSDTKISMHSEGTETTVLSLEFWDLISIHDITPGMVGSQVRRGNFGNLNVYPNPARRGDIIRLGTRKLEYSQANIAIFDSSGKMIHQEPTYEEFKLNTEMMLPGLYLIQMIDGNQVQSCKLIIQ